MVLAFAGYTAFAFSDTCVKILAERGYSIYQIVTIDTGIGALLLLLVSSRMGGLASLKDGPNAKIHAIRTLLNFVINLLLVYCLSIMPLATVYTAVFTKPVMAILIAAPLYGERIGLHRATAIALGLFGIMIAFQPWQSGADTQNIPLLMLMAFTVALMFVLTRSLKGSSALAMSFYPVAGTCLLTLPLMIMDYTPVAAQDFLLFILSGALIATAITCVSWAFRIADSAAVSPMMYTEMIWAMLFGALIFGDIPGPMMLIGVGFIIIAGFILVLSERR
ncbi:MAG: DMT family transporter [Alphaproteobacteria bacterium]|nr:DMT family transporter [Alphaproteobacteria bacterium]